MNKNIFDEVSKQTFVALYSKLGIEDSHYIAYRDVSMLIKKHCPDAKKTLDYGSGAGRSTKLLKELDLQTVGVDINPSMIEQARSKDPKGKYLHIKSGVLPFPDGEFDLAFSGIVFVEISSKEELVKVLKEIKRVLKNRGKFILLTSTPEGYVTDSGQFIGDLPENKNLKSGDKVKVVVRGFSPALVFYDYYWTDEDYQEVFSAAGLQLLEAHIPVPTDEDLSKLYVKVKTVRWVLYVLEKHENDEEI